jgi:parallel beta-helix repeat protein
LITLEKPVAGIQAGADHRTGDTIYNLSASGAGFVIRNNRFHHHRRHGVLARAGNGLIEGNTFEESGGFGVTITNEPEWPEGPVATDITVRGNRFIGGGHPGGYGDSPKGAALTVRAKGLGERAEGRLIRRITIEDNTFVDPPGGAIYIGSAEGVTIRNNTASSTGTRTGANSAVILLDNVAGAVVEGLSVTGAKQWTAAVRVTESVAPGAEGASIKDSKIEPAGAIETVRDERK